MATEVTREEFEARVGVLEHEVEGEKLITRHILEQTRRNGDDLAAVKARLDRVETGSTALSRDLEALSRDLEALSTDLGESSGKSIR